MRPPSKPGAERVDVLLSTWRQARAHASADDCRAVAAYLRDRLEPQLALLRETVERDEPTDDHCARPRVDIRRIRPA